LPDYHGYSKYPAFLTGFNIIRDIDTLFPAVALTPSSTDAWKNLQSTQNGSFSTRARRYRRLRNAVIGSELPPDHTLSTAEIAR